MAQGTRLTEQQTQAILADYALTQSYRAVARKYNIADNTVKRVVERSPQMAAALAVKKEETSLTVLDWLERQGKRHQDILDKLLNQIEAGADTLSPAQAATIYGIMVDKQNVIKGTGGVNINISFGAAPADDINKYGK